MNTVPASVQFELANGERQLWSGTPRTGLRLRANDVLWIPFSIAWSLYALMVTAGAMFGGIGFVIAGGLLMLAAVYLTVGRFWFDMSRRETTAYAITTERIIVRSGASPARTHSLPLRSLTEITLSEETSGEGTITFERLGLAARVFAGVIFPSPQAAFELIPNAKQVYAIIHDARAAASARAV